MVINTESYIALSALSYSDLTGLDNKTVEDLISADYQDRIKDYKDLRGNINPEFQALSTILSWKLIAFQPNTASGFSGAAFQSPSGEIVFAFRRIISWLKRFQSACCYS